MNTQPFGKTAQKIQLCSEYLYVRCILLYLFFMSRTRFRVNPHSIFALMSRNSLLEAGAKCEGEVTATWLEPTTTLFLNEHSTIWSKWPNNWAVFWVLICTVHLTECSCHVMYASHGEYKLYIWMNVKELLARNRREIWRWSDRNGTRTQNHLVLKWTLNHLVKLSKRLSCVLSTYMYGAFDSIFSSCHVRVSEWIHTLYSP